MDFVGRILEYVAFNFNFLDRRAAKSVKKGRFFIPENLCVGVALKNRI